MPRLVVLAVLVAAAGVAVLLVRDERPLGGQAAVHGPRVFRTSPGAVERVVVTVGDRAVDARRQDGAWTVAGRRAGAQTRDALDDLTRELCALRAVDRFRPRDGATFGLAVPGATVTVDDGRRETRLLLGHPNAARSALYARRDASSRVLVIGIGLLTSLERVLYFERVERGGAASGSAPAPAARSAPPA